jgi:hypothetical protein
MPDTVSRFRPDHAKAPGIPTSAGHCPDCLRKVWRGRKRGEALLSVTDRHGGACESCAKWRDEHPGQDPTHAKRSRAERIPAEREEHAPRWRDHPGRGCREVPPLAFEPDPDRDEDGHDEVSRQFRADMRREMAVRVCLPCPVREKCFAAALAHGYEGLWGAAVFGRSRWDDLLTGDSGRTIHAKRRRTEPAEDIA